MSGRKPILGVFDEPEEASDASWHMSHLNEILGTGAFTESAAIEAVRRYFIRHVPLPSEIRRVPLTRGYWAIVDAADFDWLMQWEWCVSAAGKFRTHFHAARNAAIPGPSLMHALILPVEKPLVVDHVNGDSLDNRRANLRPATPSQNGANGRRHGKAAHGFKGIYFDNARKCWAAQIKVNYITRSLGRFDTPEDAAKVYDVAALEAWGEYAKPNFPR